MDYDVAVVGAGPCGSTAAYHLARAGKRVLLLERASFPRDKPCGGGVTARALAQAPVDLGPVVEHEVRKVRFSFRLGEFYDYEYPKTLVYMTQRPRLDAYLAESAVLAGACLVEKAQAREVTLGEDGLVVVTSGGAYSARAVIGADGANGVVARSLDLAPAPEPPVALEATFSYADGQRPRPWQGCFGMELGSIEGGYGWSFPKADHFNIGCGGFAHEGARLRGHLASLAAHYGLEDPPAARIRGHRVPTRADGRPIARGPALLAGDAAGLVDPMSGEGIFAAFVSGRLAAHAVLAFLSGRAPDVMPYEAAVERDLMPDLRAATLLRDAYHYLPGASYALMRRWPYLRASLCRLMLGETTYAGFLERAPPLRPVLALAAALGRRHRRRRRA